MLFCWADLFDFIYVGIFYTFVPIKYERKILCVDVIYYWLSVTWCLGSKAHAGFEGIHKTICYHMRDGESMFQVSDKNTEEEKK